MFSPPIDRYIRSRMQKVRKSPSYWIARDVNHLDLLLDSRELGNLALEISYSIGNDWKSVVIWGLFVREDIVGCVWHFGFIVIESVFEIIREEEGFSSRSEVRVDLKNGHDG